MEFGEWITLTGELQREAFGVEPSELTADPEALGDYLHLNITGAFTEVAEISEVVGWKPWAKTRGWVNREELVKETVDVLHFLANLLWISGVTGVELDAAYRKKLGINAGRQAEGYEQRGAPSVPDVKGRDL